MTHKIEPLPKGKGKLINPDDLKQVFERDKIEPLKIEEYEDKMDIPPGTHPYFPDGYSYKTFLTNDAIRALFAKLNEVIYKLEEKEEV